MPYQVFPCSDGHFIIACGNDRQFAALCTALGRAELAQNPSYATNAARVAHRDDLSAILSDLTRTRTRSDWLTALEAVGVPAGPINTVQDALNEPQIAARGMKITPEGLPGLRSPIRFSRSGLSLGRAAPFLGPKIS